MTITENTVAAAAIALILIERVKKNLKVNESNAVLIWARFKLGDLIYIHNHHTQNKINTKLPRLRAKKRSAIAATAAAAATTTTSQTIIPKQKHNATKKNCMKD